MIYQVKIMAAKISEINAVHQALKLDLWNGVNVNGKRLAEQIANDARYVAPLIEIDVIEVCA